MYKISTDYDVILSKIWLWRHYDDVIYLKTSFFKKIWSTPIRIVFLVCLRLLVEDLSRGEGYICPLLRVKSDKTDSCSNQNPNFIKTLQQCSGFG